MTRVMTVLLCSFLGAFITYGSAYIIGALFGPLYNSEDDMVRNFRIFLYASLGMIIVGGLLGNWLYKKYLSDD